MVSFSNPRGVANKLLKALAKGVFAMIIDINTQMIRIIPPEVFEDRNFLKTVKFMSFAMRAVSLN
ncbi:hypothetical protein GCM10022216_21790 [Sphingobacterium kyonggiense]|uniref:Uncharacterized protein n=1 Tax=Sphingobacterium kyonggiense TaxID=714075 RepID=A0ABP7YUR4_9SPHI